MLGARQRVLWKRGCGWAAGLICCLIGGARLAAEENAAPTAGEYSTVVKIDVTYRYLVSLPEGYEADPQRDWPLMVFLHGAGERGDKLEMVQLHGPLKRIAAGERLPMIVVAPQCPAGSFWYPDAVAGLTRDIIGRYRVDRNRVYLTGLSMGGFGTWQTAARHPDLFAALVPICGGGDTAEVSRIRHLPIWVFHGAKDLAVPLVRSQEMVDALRGVAGNVRFTVYPEAGHDSWTETYDDPRLYDWLLEQRR